MVISEKEIHLGDLYGALSRIGMRLRLRDSLEFGQRTLWAAASGMLSIQIAGRVWPLENVHLWSLAPIAVWLIGLAVYLLAQRYSALRSARCADLALGLKERLSTAVVFDQEKDTLESMPHDGELVLLQRQDALEAARKIKARKSFPFEFQTRPMMVAIGLIIVGLMLAGLPNPMDAVLAERAAVAEAAKAEADEIETLREEIEKADEMSEEEQQALLEELAELAEQLRANPGDRAETLTELSSMEAALRDRLTPYTDLRQRALDSLASRLESLGRESAESETAPSGLDEALDRLVEQFSDLDAAGQKELAQSVREMAAQMGQAGNANLAESLSALASAMQSGDGEGILQAAGEVGESFAQTQSELTDQQRLEEILARLQESRQAVSQAGQGQAAAQSNGTGQGQSQGQGQGQGQGSQPSGGGGGSNADTLPPYTGSGGFVNPQGAGSAPPAGLLQSEVYVPPVESENNGDTLVIPGQDSGEGQTIVREQDQTLPGASNPALVPYVDVFQNYLDTASQVLDQSYIPFGLKDYIQQYFSQLEPSR